PGTGARNFASGAPPTSPHWPTGRCCCTPPTRAPAATCRRARSRACTPTTPPRPAQPDAGIEMHADTSPRPTAPDPAGSAASTAAPRPRAPSAGHGGVGIFEPRRFERVVAGNIIPPTAWAALEEVDQLVEKVNALYEGAAAEIEQDRKSTRLNSSHVKISYAVFCLKKKNY